MAPESENRRSTQTFIEYMSDFLTSHPSNTIVEVGPDLPLKTAVQLAPHTSRYYAVGLPNEINSMGDWHALHSAMGVSNIELIAGNATNLSELVPKSDIVLFHNVLLDLTGQDASLSFRYWQDKIDLTDEEYHEMTARFNKAEFESYKEALKVADPGIVISFQRKVDNGRFDNFLTEKLQVDPVKIERQELLYDDSDRSNGTDDQWVAYIIDNN